MVDEVFANWVVSLERARHEDLGPNAVRRSDEQRPAHGAEIEEACERPHPTHHFRPRGASR
jgi:hypothetical protein